MSSPTRKKAKVLQGALRNDLLKEEVIKEINTAWTCPTSETLDLKSLGVEIIADPFPVCVVQNFIEDPEILKLATEELKDVTFHQKSNDLYQFKQSDDVKNLTNFTYIPQLYELISIKGLNWVKKVSGDKRLKDEISATFSSYEYKDRLLCHDDKCEDRHIAFVLYLVEDWCEEDGGALQLFNTDSNCYPDKVVRTICPKNNTMVLFEVTHQSFHEVAEVLSRTKKRLSLNGWFHSSGKKLIPHTAKVLESEAVLGKEDSFNLDDFFLFTYLEKLNRLDIKAMFLAESEIQLQEFLVPKFWEEIVKEVKSEGIKWAFKGPANIRKYEVVDTTTLMPSTSKLQQIFQSNSWFKYLRSITGLDFVPSDTSDLEIWEKGHLPDCTFELQKWTHGCYTLIHDQDPEFHSKGLDVILRIPFEGNENHETVYDEDTPEAGHIIYIDADSRDEECLLHIGYKMNSLALIFRDTKTLRFTKYLDSTAESFYQVFCTYRPWRPPENEPNLKHCEESESEGSNSECEELSEDESS